MITPPIKIWTPPISVTKPAKPSAASANEPASAPAVKKPAKTTSSRGSSQKKAAVPTLDSLFQEMLKKYLPETVDFEPVDEQVLSETIRNWIRPAYEQAIENRRAQTERINAELDADAWSRGMGESTYLTDVKERQLRGEARDVDALESNYASALAGHLYDAMKEQQARKIEVDEFNAEQINRSREKAMTAARELYRTYLAAAKSSGRSGTKKKTATAAKKEAGSFTEALVENAKTQPKTSYRTAANMIARMSPKERGRLYNGSDPGYLGLRSEILYSLGSGGFEKLKRSYPASK